MDGLPLATALPVLDMDDDGDHRFDAAAAMNARRRHRRAAAMGAVVAVMALVTAVHVTTRPTHSPTPAPQVPRAVANHHMNASIAGVIAGVARYVERARVYLFTGDPDEQGRTAVGAAATGRKSHTDAVDIVEPVVVPATTPVIGPDQAGGPLVNVRSESLNNETKIRRTRIRDAAP